MVEIFSNRTIRLQRIWEPGISDSPSSAPSRLPKSQRDLSQKPRCQDPGNPGRGYGQTDRITGRFVGFHWEPTWLPSEFQRNRHILVEHFNSVKSAFSYGNLFSRKISDQLYPEGFQFHLQQINILSFHHTCTLIQNLNTGRIYAFKSTDQNTRTSMQLGSYFAFTLLKSVLRFHVTVLIS